MKEINYNPDVLTCLANLSNDEVFTPPTIVNQMLDTLPKELWNNSKAKFLDPFSKSGVFLREIVKRLNTGLEKEIPDLQDRINHILKNQVYGIAITELTALLTRRSLYCSKYANGKKSITNIFKNEDGNIAYERIEHTFENGKCKYCGASEDIYDRGEELESHAYIFIHNKNPYKNMQFDVIIGNPPYQLSDGGGTGSSAMPIYHKFIQKSINLRPKYLSMIVPARWFTGGRGLDEFRDEMLNDKRIQIIHDFPNSNDCFSGVQIEGGICYFLWNNSHNGDCEIYTHSSEGKISFSKRPMFEAGVDIFVRYNQAMSILDKVRLLKEKSFSDLISSNDPFGFDTREDGSYKRVKPIFENSPFENSVKFYYYGWQRTGIGYIEKNTIRKNSHLIDKYKIYISKAYGMGNFPSQVINTPFLGTINSCCTETYLLIGPFDDEKQANNIISYIKTIFFRFLVLLIKNTQNAMKKVYQFVPMQDFNEEWTDEKLYKKYGLSQEEIDFIESMIRPME